MLTIDELIEAGVLMTPEQIDFFHHPQDRLAVVVYGIPDPDRLYISGPDRDATYYQQAPPGEPADEHGLAACVVPIVMLGDDQENLSRMIADWEGDIEEDFPVVHGWPHGADFTFAWTTDEIPITVACWDLWPIAAEDTTHWIGAADNAYYASALPPMFELVDNYNGSEYYGERVNTLTDQSYDVTNEIRALEKKYEGRSDQDQYLLELTTKYDELIKEIEKESGLHIARLEQQILHPVTGEIDAQLPPVNLPPEQAALWRSLQSLSWRNWSHLAKEDPTGCDALYGSRFVQANRRLCPWY